MKKKVTAATPLKRPPVVVVMGHIDHGKSSLLDYIRKSNSVAGEAGGITQHLSAYVAEHTTEDGTARSMTFLDTPGHEAFQKMRLRGADIADIAILVVSAEDGVKPQTLEALASINQAAIPYIVAINKVDKPAADIPRTQASLIEHEIYIEGMGGSVPWVAISAKTGQGIDELLELVLLTADLNDLITDPSLPGSGRVLEGQLDAKRGATATLIVEEGTVTSGTFVVSGTAYAPVRIMENFLGKPIKEAGASTPIGIVGFNGIPAVGATFVSVKTKKEAEAMVAEAKAAIKPPARINSSLPIIPILIKADVLGTIDAIEHELAKITSDRILVRVIGKGVGDITTNDIQNVSATKDAIVVGFNTKVERQAADLAERLGVEINTFSIIYDLSLWLNTALKNRTPKREEIVVTGKVKLLKYFSTQKNTHVLGARLEEGAVKMNQKVRITRRDIEIGKGVIKNLQQYKSNVQQITEGEFGLQLETKTEIAPGDYLETYDVVVS